MSNTKKDPAADPALASQRKRSIGYTTMGEKITQQVQHAIDTAVTKRRLCKILGISFPTLQDRFYADTWTAREKYILIREGIIKSKYHDVDTDTDEGLVEGRGTLYPTRGVSVRLSRTKKGKSQ